MIVLVIIIVVLFKISFFVIISVSLNGLSNMIRTWMWISVSDFYFDVNCLNVHIQGVVPRSKKCGKRDFAYFDRLFLSISMSSNFLKLMFRVISRAHL